MMMMMMTIQLVSLWLVLHRVNKNYFANI
jgi:hypothetical protein